MENWTHVWNYGLPSFDFLRHICGQMQHAPGVCSKSRSPPIKLLQSSHPIFNVRKRQLPRNRSSNKHHTRLARNNAQIRGSFPKSLQIFLVRCGRKASTIGYNGSDYKPCSVQLINNGNCFVMANSTTIWIQILWASHPFPSSENSTFLVFNSVQKAQ